MTVAEQGSEPARLAQRDEPVDRRRSEAQVVFLLDLESGAGDRDNAADEHVRSFGELGHAGEGEGRTLTGWSAATSCRSCSKSDSAILIRYMVKRPSQGRCSRTRGTYGGCPSQGSIAVDARRTGATAGRGAPRTGLRSEGSLHRLVSGWGPSRTCPAARSGRRAGSGEEAWWWARYSQAGRRSRGTRCSRSPRRRPARLGTPPDAAPRPRRRAGRGVSSAAERARRNHAEKHAALDRDRARDLLVVHGELALRVRVLHIRQTS